MEWDVCSEPLTLTVTRENLHELCVLTAYSLNTLDLILEVCGTIRD